MDIVFLEKLVQSQFVWAIACVIVTIIFYRNFKEYVARLVKSSDQREKNVAKLYEESKKESKEREAQILADSRQREEKLMNHLEKTTDTLQGIEQGLSKLEKKMDNGFQDVWDHIKKGDVSNG